MIWDYLTEVRFSMIEVVVINFAVAILVSVANRVIND